MTRFAAACAIALLAASSPARAETTATPPPGPAPKPPPTRRVVTLDRAKIQHTMGRFQMRIAKCGKTGLGKMRLTVLVAPSGAVTKVTIATTPDPSIDTCVARIVKGIAFPATDTGGAFSYPIVF